MQKSVDFNKKFLYFLIEDIFIEERKTLIIPEPIIGIRCEEINTELDPKKVSVWISTVIGSRNLQTLFCCKL